MTVPQIATTQKTCDSREKCPFLADDCGQCKAALLRFMPDSRQLYHYCCSDDYDDCPVFLAKALRSSAPVGHIRDIAAYCEK